MSRGRFGEYGGQYMSETLMNELLNLEEQYEFYKNDPEFQEELNQLLKEYADVLLCYIMLKELLKI